jgi:GDP-L-fucose synthase
VHKEIYPLAGKTVFVAGHNGMVGAGLVRRLASENCTILTAPRDLLDLTDARAVDAWFAANKPQAVFLAAAKVGGILANDTYPAEFLHINLAIQTAVIDAAWRHGVEKLMFLGSSCIYPKMAPQPIPESALLTGPLESSNEWYAIAKIAGLKMCEAYRKQYGADFISVMPTNLFGTGDNFDLQKSHVVAALLRKAHEAKAASRQELEVWGSGRVYREFLHVDDAADAMVFLMKTYSEAQHINVGSGEDLTIEELAHLVCKVVGLDARITFDRTKLDGTPRKQLDVGKLFSMGWKPSRSLESGLEEAYRYYRDSLAN